MSLLKSTHNILGIKHWRNETKINICHQISKLSEAIISTVQFSCSVMSDSLRPHEPQHARLPCPSPTTGVHPNSCPLSRWCHPTISSSVIPFSSCPQSLPASGSFQMSQPFASGGQRIGVSASTSVFPMNTQDWSPLGCCTDNAAQPTENLPSSKQVFGSHPPHHPS